MNDLTWSYSMDDLIWQTSKQGTNLEQKTSRSSEPVQTHLEFFAHDAKTPTNKSTAPLRYPTEAPLT